ncbi:HD domain-containing protein [Kitasatospora sp. CB02891]|uniref:HD domain-containing protein n=1 Tax=Kitasatospora sp. CB02891 TaxID=2020329 RepID=UPI000C279E40|nr:HD domain-containing protein [Kitasatospora sp. CB02891]PJN21839.1 phosphohydrolase [Kitasatospora sp. CB02891]
MDHDDLPLCLLPDEVTLLLAELAAPPRLVAHLRLVHDVAVRLVDRAAAHCPALEFDRAAVLFGAATHDIGKAVHRAELSAPGSAHEPAGRELLLTAGVAPRLARFAAGHATWGPDTGVEDLLVSLADQAWKNKRVPVLEDLLVTALVRAGGGERWEAFLVLDELLAAIGDGAEERLAYQALLPTS